MARTGETYALPACTWNMPLSGDTLDPAGWSTLILDIRDAITGSAARAGATFTGAIKVANGAAGTPSYTFTNATNTGFYHTGATSTSTLTFSANSVDKFRSGAAASTELQIYRSAAWRNVVDSSSTQTLTGAFTYSGVVNLNAGGSILGLWTGNHDYSGVIEFGGNISIVSANLTSSSATMTGTWLGTPTFSGNVAFTGSPAFSVGTPTFANGSSYTGGTLTANASTTVDLDAAASVLVPNAALTTNDTHAVSTSIATTALALKANLASPTFTGTVTLPGTVVDGSAHNVFTVGSGWVDGAAGTMTRGSSWITPSRVSAGRYRLTHNLNTTSIVGVGSVISGGGATERVCGMDVSVSNVNYIEMVTESAAGTAGDSDFTFMLIRTA